MTVETQELITAEVSDGIYYSTAGGGALFNFKDYGSNRAMERGAVTQVKVGEGLGAKKVKYWGCHNNLPQIREALVCSNNIVGPLLATKRDITLGSHVIAYKEEFVDGDIIKIQVPIPAEAKAFFDKVNIKRYLRQACRELYFHANVFTEFVRDLEGKIASIKLQKCKHIRAEEMNEYGDIKNYWWSGYWGTKRSKDARKIKYIQVPAYTGEEKKQKKFLLHVGDDLCGDDYYFEPSWWGGKTWIEVANCIPEFHKWNLKHGYTIRWHVQIPKGYFHNNAVDVVDPKIRKEMALEAKARKEKFIEKCNKFLAGVENTGRAVFTDYDISKNLGKEYSGIKITALSADLKDTALLELFEKSNQANISGQGIHPTLANIETAGKLSSGSEIRNALTAYVAIKTPQPRMILFEAIDLVKKINKWPEDVHYWVKDMEITSLDVEPSGSVTKITK